MEKSRNQWSKIGAWQGGSVTSVALSPTFTEDNVAIIATSAGIFRSAKGDNPVGQWSLAMDGFSDPSALAVAKGSGSAGAVLFASSEQGRLFRSDDLGASWSEIASWAGLGVGSAIALSSDFASDQTLFVATANGIFRTLDGGESWQEASFGLLDLDVICLALSPDFAHSQTLWVGTALGGLFRSRNVGRAWRESGEGLPDCAVQSIALSPNFATDQTLFAGMEEGGVYRSQDGGRSWTLAGEALTEIGVNALAIFSDTDTDADGDATGGFVLVAGTAAGIYTSNDGGETWALELADLPILDLALAEGGAGMAAVYQQGCFIRNAASAEWQTAADGIVAHAPPQLVRSDTGLLLALDGDGEMALSQNGGVDWQPLSAPDALSPTVAIAFASVEGEACFYAASLEGLYCMPVDQHEWHELLTPPLVGEDSIVQLAVVAVAEQVRIALGSAQGDVWWLDDEGREWQQLEQPWRGVHLLSLFFATDEQGDTLLHALTAAENAQQNYDIELWAFDDVDEEWSSLAMLESESPAVLTLATDIALFLATQNRLIKLFNNLESAELEVAQHFFAEETRITALARSAVDATLLLATTAALHQSSDEGASWQEIQTLPTRQPIVSILPSPESNQLAVISLGGEVWSLGA